MLFRSIHRGCDKMVSDQFDPPACSLPSLPRFVDYSSRSVPHHTQIHGGYHYPHPAAAYPPPPPGFVPVPANTTPIHHHRPGFVPSPAYAPPPPVPDPPPAQAYGPFGYYPAAATPSTAAPLAVAATPHANFSFPSTAENSDLVFHRATPEFRCQDSKTAEDGSAPPRQDFALHTEKSGSATACKDYALQIGRAHV